MVDGTAKRDIQLLTKACTTVCSVISDAVCASVK